MKKLLLLILLSIVTVFTAFQAVYADNIEVEISGVSVPEKHYDGEPNKISGKPKATADGVSVMGAEFSYTYKDEDGNILDDAPVDVGKYQLTIAIDKEGYVGESSYNCIITPREVTCKPVDISIRKNKTIGDIEVEFYGMLSDDVIEMSDEPEFQIVRDNGTVVTKEQAAKKTGTYDIEWINADDIIFYNDNYNVTTQNGTLKVKDSASTESTSSSTGTSSSYSTSRVIVRTNIHGTVTVGEMTSDYRQTFKFKAKDGYFISDVLVDDVSVGAVSEYTFKDANKDHIIKAVYEEIPTEESLKWENPYIDVSEKKWYYNAVKYVSENEIMNGVTNRRFKPNQNITRGMLVTILYRAEGEPDAANCKFTDVSPDEYYEKAVSWANSCGMVTGVSETEFSPDSEVTREQLASIIYRYAKTKSLDTKSFENYDMSKYSDYDDVSDYAKPAVKYVIGSGLITGKTSTTVNPKDTATRAEVATVLMRFFENNNKETD